MAPLNVLVVSLDSLRRDHCGFHGNSWIRTPNLDRFAARSVVFENAYCGSYACVPARRDLYTGRLGFPWKGSGPLDPEDRDLPSLVSGPDHEIPSMLVTDHYHLFGERAGNYHFGYTGWDFVRGAETDRWITDPRAPKRLPRPPWPLSGHPSEAAWRAYERNGRDRAGEDDTTGGKVMARTAQWIRENATSRPFFAMVDCVDPHEPFDPPLEFRDLYLKDYAGPNIIWPRYGDCAHMTESQIRCVRANYAGKVTLIDKQFGRVLDALDEQDLWKRTMVVVLSDHGHLLGEHGTMGKPVASQGDASMYEELARIPFVVWHPDNPAPGRRVASLVQAVDLFPTLLEAVGRKIPGGIHGRPLTPILRGGAADLRTIRDVCSFGRFGEAVHITDGEWTLRAEPDAENRPLFWYGQAPRAVQRRVKTPARFDGGRFPVELPRGRMTSALHRIASDPRQEKNLIDSETGQGDRLRRRLREFIHEIEAPEEQLLRLGIA